MLQRQAAVDLIVRHQPIRGAHQSMPLSRITGFDLPVGFDVAAYDRVNDQAVLIANPNDTTAPWKQNSWFGYASAWNGLAIRLRSAVEYDAEFGRLIAPSTAPGQEERYNQERALFGCIASALSAIECFYMATYCLAAVLSPSHFPLQKDKHLVRSPCKVAKAHLAWLPADSFPQLLWQIAHSSALAELADLRNALAHRGVLPRRHFFSNVVDMPSAVPSNPKALAGNFYYSASLSDATTSIHTRWLCQIASQLVAECNRFLARCT